jgi:hypothetical protein
MNGGKNKASTCHEGMGFDDTKGTVLESGAHSHLPIIEEK